MGSPINTETSAAESRAFQVAVKAVRNGSPALEEAKRLLAQLNADDQRLSLLDGDTPCWEGIVEAVTVGYNVRPYVHGGMERLGIPGIRFVDGPRGCVSGHGTAFPVAMARGASWDVELEEKIGETIGQEVRAVGGNFFGGVCVNLLRHPAWGRAQETYGEESYHLGEMGAAATRGVQKHVMACVKHFALNSMENVRFKVDVTVDEATLHDVYLPHFKRVIDEGVAGVMSAYNSVNGEWAGQNKRLLDDVLRGIWGFSGFTISDFVFGLRDAAKSLNAGLDIEAPYSQQRAQHLRRQIEAGETDWDAVDRACLRLLKSQLEYYAKHDPAEAATVELASASARELARESAARSMVLLKNDTVEGETVLPLSPEKTESIALIGRFADVANMGDHGSSNVRPPCAATPLDGLREAFPGAKITVVSADDLDAATEAARNSQVAIVVAGYDYADEGEYFDPNAMRDPELMALYPPPPPELDLASMFTNTEFLPKTESGGDRESLTLRPIDEQMILAVQAANPRTVVAVIASSAVLKEAWRHQVPAIVMMWYAGMEGGRALADVLTGRQNPSGRLPFSVPTSVEHLPYYDRKATAITYERDYGQRRLDRLGVEPAFPLGFGLSYTSFGITEARATSVSPDGVILGVTVANTGARDGRHVVQVYGETADEKERFLVGFRCVFVTAGATKTFDIPVSFTPLARWDTGKKTRILPDRACVSLSIGANARDPEAIVLRTLE